MNDPSVVVQRAPDGWTHIGGPGMHLLIALEEEDDRTLTASDAADGGELDDVIEVLTAGGVRKAHHFVGVHWVPRTRIVAFGPVSARLTTADGTEHEVRASNPRVWTDLVLDTHPERVELRVLDDLELEEPAPAQTLIAGPGGVAVVAVLPPEADGTATVAPAPPSGSEAPSLSSVAQTSPSTEAPDPAEPSPPAGAPDPAEPSPPAGALEPAEPPAPPASAPRSLPTFGAVRSEEGAAQTSSWGRSWARPGAESSAVPEASSAAEAAGGSLPPAPPEGTRVPEGTRAPEPAVPEPAPPPVRPEGAALRPWGPGPAVQPRRAAPRPPQDSEPTAAAAPARERAATPEDPPAPPTAPEAADLPAAHTGPVDVESTWAARPTPPTGEDSPGPSAGRSPEPPPRASVGPLTAGQPIPEGEPGTPAEDEAAVPSYDYLFGHTVTVDEHRKILAGLDSADAGSNGDGDDPGPTPSAATASGAVTAPGSVTAPGPDAPATASSSPSSPPASPSGAPGPSTPGPATPGPATPEPATPEPSTPAPSVPASSPPGGGGLISSVPWATGSSTTDSSTTGSAGSPGSRAEVPSFSGRHTPPPAPSLIPPLAGPAAVPAAPDPGGHSPRQADASPPAATPPTPSLGGGPATEAVSDANADADELTVDRSALIQARQAVQSGAGTGPSVLAVLCSQGHPTPPHGDSCRICGSSIPSQDTFTMPRPPLGLLRLSTGDVVTLDRSVLLGRAPTLGSALAVTDRPHVVKVPSPERDVSRNHVEVVLEGWHVLIRDLGTTNGTTVTLPGGQPVRLRANDQQVLEPGSIVSMADEVSFIFDPGTS